MCKCDCGNSKVVQARHLTDGSTVSCGCYAREQHSKHMKETISKDGTHFMSNTRIYRIWGNMNNRCDNPRNPAYDNYGGRGIKVCDEWKSFENFYDWAINNGYTDNLTIDRIDVDNGYNPDNCRWVGRDVQSNNKRTNRFFTFNGETHTLKEWSDIFNVSYKTVHARISRGWDFERAIFEPLHIA